MRCRPKNQRTITGRKQKPRNDFTCSLPSLQRPLKSGVQAGGTAAHGSFVCLPGPLVPMPASARTPHTALAHELCRLLCEAPFELSLVIKIHSGGCCKHVIYQRSKTSHTETCQAWEIAEETPNHKAHAGIGQHRAAWSCCTCRTGKASLGALGPLPFHPAGAQAKGSQGL